MKLKSERIKELERENLDLSRSINGTRHQLMCAEAAVRDRNEKIAELEEQLGNFKDMYAKAVWDMADYVAFYERIKAFVESFEEEKDEPKVLSIDLTNQLEPEVVGFCNFMTSIVDKIVGEENG